MSDVDDVQDADDPEDPRPVPLPLPEPLPLTGRTARLTEAAQARWNDARERFELVDLAGAIADRDKDAHGSVLGSALALRLFLFLVPTTVVVAVNLSPEGRPESGTIRMLSSSGGSGDAAKQAFEAARRAIIRCGASGFDLPAEKYDQWRDIEMTFNPERMRIK